MVTTSQLKDQVDPGCDTVAMRASLPSGNVRRPDVRNVAAYQLLSEAW